MSEKRFEFMDSPESAFQVHFSFDAADETLRPFLWKNTATTPKAAVRDHRPKKRKNQDVHSEAVARRND